MGALVNALHWSASHEWYTPVDIVQRAAAVLGEIDLDPASCAQANETVRAKKYYTREEDGLTRDWYGNVFLNPPSGKACGPKPFWSKLIRSREHIRHAIYVAFSMEQLQSLQNILHIPAPFAFPVCIPAKRLNFASPEPKIKNQPTHGNAIVYVPGTRDESAQFKRVFSEIGAVKL